MSSRRPVWLLALSFAFVMLSTARFMFTCVWDFELLLCCSETKRCALVLAANSVRSVTWMGEYAELMMVRSEVRKKSLAQGLCLNFSEQRSSQDAHFLLGDLHPKLAVVLVDPCYHGRFCRRPRQRRPCPCRRPVLVIFVVLLSASHNSSASKAPPQRSDSKQPVRLSLVEASGMANKTQREGRAMMCFVAHRRLAVET